MLSKDDFIIPQWPVPANVHALQTTRQSGFSVAPYHSLNLAMHVGDNPVTVAANRQLLSPFLPSEPVWLNQVHGVAVIDAGVATCVSDADASYSRQAGAVCAVMTADCLPVLLCDKQGTQVAAIHAGWKGLLDGVLEVSIANMTGRVEDLLVWLGPAIGPQAFEVGSEVREAFVAKQAQAASAFTALPNDKWLGDIYQLARFRLTRLGVQHVYGGGLCTYTESERFFSFRRDGATGRMLTAIWLS